MSPDELHEQRIYRALQDFNREPTTLKWRLVTKLVRERSPEQVRRMERARGIA